MTDLRVSAGAHGPTGAVRRAGTSYSPVAAVSAAWRRHSDLLSNAGSLLASTGVTSVLGVRLLDIRGARVQPGGGRIRLGCGVGHDPARHDRHARPQHLAHRGAAAAYRPGRPGMGRPYHQRTGVSAARAGLCGRGLRMSASASRKWSARQTAAVLFAVGVALIGVSMVFDQATIGLLRGGLQLQRNIAFAIGKMVILLASALILHDQFGVGITLSWVAGVALSLGLLAVRLWFDDEPVMARPDWGALRGLGRSVMAHNWLNLALMMPIYLTPVLVTVIVSPSANAAFYIAAMLSAFLFIVPSHLATVLFAVVAADPKVLARKLRFALRVSFMIGLPAMAVLILCARPVLGLFGKDYTEATVPLWLMTLGYPAAVPRTLYIAVCRASGQITRAAVVLSLCSSAEIAAAVAGGMAGGLVGLSLALLAVRYAEALVTIPPVIRAASGHGRHRRLA